MPPKTLALPLDMRDAARFITDDTAGHTYETLRADRRVRQLVERNLEFIGEAMRRLSREDAVLAARISAYPRVIGMRNALIHGYDVINHATVWLTVQEALPVPQAEVEHLLHEEAKHDAPK